ncbi:MAG: hypothetical protein ACYCZM_11105 [Acidimicrobiales bacterium]
MTTSFRRWRVAAWTAVSSEPAAPIFDTERCSSLKDTSHNCEGAARDNGVQLVGFSCHHPGWWCLEKPIAANGRRSVDLPGGTQSSLLTCRDEVADALQVVAAGGRGRSFTVEEVYTTMAAIGTSWPRATVAKTMLRMTRPARRSPRLRLERGPAGHYRLATP